MSIFDASVFVPRGSCGQWNNWFEFLYMFSNLMITLAYLAIPYVFWRYEFNWIRLGKMNSMRVFLVLFVLTCGIGHLEGVVSFTWPAYHLFAIWDCIVAFCSWAFVFAVVFNRDKLSEVC